MASALDLVQMDGDIHRLDEMQRRELDYAVASADLDAKSADQFDFTIKTVDAAPNVKFIPAGVVARALGMQYESNKDRSHFKERVLEKHPLFECHWKACTKQELRNGLFNRGSLHPSLKFTQDADGLTFQIPGKS